MASLEEKVIIITGASAGIGKGIAVYMAQFKPRLVLAARNIKGLEETRTQCQQAGLAKEKILTVVCDVTKDGDLQNLVDTTIKTFGSIYGLVNNAGICIYSNVENSDMNDYDNIMKVNVRAPFYLSKLCIPHLKLSKGCVVNMSSILAQKGIASTAAYCMSKASLDHFTHLLSAETAPYGIRVNCVSPGVTRSEFQLRSGVPEKALDDLYARQSSAIPLGRIGEPEDVAKLVKFLLSDESSYITGEVICVDGGRNNPVYPTWK